MRYLLHGVERVAFISESLLILYFLNSIFLWHWSLHQLFLMSLWCQFHYILRECFINALCIVSRDLHQSITTLICIHILEKLEAVSYKSFYCSRSALRNTRLPLGESKNQLALHSADRFISSIETTNKQVK